MKNLILSSSRKYQLLVALSLCFWVTLFLILIGPFDASDVSLKNRLIMMPGYGVILFISYLLTIPFQELILDPNTDVNRWNVRLEVMTVSVLFSVGFLPTYMYYRSDFILGEYELLQFAVNIYVPIILVFIPLVFLMRWIVRLIQVRTEKAIILGKSKYDRIRLHISDLVFVKASDNYVEIHYLDNENLKLKLIRSTLKDVKMRVPELVQTHRSYLMNSKHFITWKDKNCLALTSAEVPVSESFKNSVSEVL